MVWGNDGKFSLKYIKNFKALPNTFMTSGARVVFVRRKVTPSQNIIQISNKLLDLLSHPVGRKRSLAA